MNYGILSLLPPLIAVILAIKSKNVILSLFAGGFAGAMILTAWNPITSIKSLVGDYYFVLLTDSYNAGVIVLLVFIGGFIKLMEKSGGANAFAQKVKKFINTKVKAQLAAWFGGILVFFSDLGTPLIVGPIFEPIFDKLKISREKLAWVLDSTSSPVAVLVPFIGWGVYIMGLIENEFAALNLNLSDYDTFIQAIPYQIYPILAILLIPIIAITKLDFSEMRRAERRVEETGAICWPSSNPQRKSEKMDEIQASQGKAIMVILPVLVVFITLFGFLGPQGFPFQKIGGNEFRIALTTGYFFAALVLIALMLIYKTKTFKEAFRIYMEGMKGMTDVAITLILAWTLGALISNLGTADYLIELLQAVKFSPVLIPAVLFLFGSFVSFSTGSSWGTFAIMMPLAIPMASAFHVPFAIAIGAVLSGGLFGDHCSPISDTTILSSTGAGCDLVDHVRTQLPYAILNGVVTFAAFVVAGITHSYVSLAVAIVLMTLCVYILSKFSGRKEKKTA